MRACRVAPFKELPSLGGDPTDPCSATGGEWDTVLGCMASLYDDGPRPLPTGVGQSRRRDADVAAAIAAAQAAQQHERLRTVVQYMNMCDTTSALLAQCLFVS